MTIVQSPSTVVRRFFATLAIAFGVAGLVVVPGDARVLAAAGAFGLMWTAWDLIMHWIVAPLIELARAVAHGTGDPRGPLNLRPSLDETIGFLHRHLDGEAARPVKVQAALRLEEIYRLVKKDEAKGRKVLEDLRMQFPDEAILEQRLAAYHREV